jgi:hypothetical protein
MGDLSPEDVIPRPLRQALVDCAADRLSGVLRVTGHPSGTIHFAEGRITAAETPGAPGLEVILLRSQRLDESGWDAAFAAAAASGRGMRAELVGRELVGAGELEALQRTAVADAIFALAYGVVDSCRTDTGAVGPPVTLEPGIEAEWLLAETWRRIRVLHSFPDPAGHARARVMNVPGAVRPGVALGDGRDELAALADGRRTPRDLAFALGRGLYATMLELGRMQAEGLILTVSGSAVSPADAADGAGTPAAAAGQGPADGLPRRRKDLAGQHGRPGGPGGRDMPAAFRLLRLRYGEGTTPGGTG